MATTRPQPGRRASTRKSMHRALAAIVLGLTAPLWHVAIAESLSEHKLKAAFLYNFTKFVEWPADRFAGATDPIVIGILADEALRAELATIVANRQVKGRALIVRLVASPADMQAAHLLFVGAQQQAHFASLRKQAPLAAVLTVGDDPRCRSHDGSICFTKQADRLRFAINMDTAERSNLKISAQLQKLAIAVNRGP